MSEETVDTNKNDVVQGDITQSDATQGDILPEEQKKTEVVFVNHKERLYDKIPITVDTLNKAIILLFIMLAAAIVIGYLKGHGMWY